MRKITPDQKLEAGKKCSGGVSYGCAKAEHDISKNQPNIFCDRCKARMGCGRCVQIPRELLCLNCRDWANKIALEAHGHIVLNRQEGIAFFEKLLKTLN